MKRLIAFYSRTGVTRRVAEALAERLGAETEEIIDTKNRSGVMGYLAAGKDATMRKLTEIAPTVKNPADYELVVLGTPVWAWTMTPAVRTYIARHREALGRVAFFCTMGGSGGGTTFKAMAKAVGAQPIATLALKERDVKADRAGPAIGRFAQALQGQ